MSDVKPPIDVGAARRAGMRMHALVGLLLAAFIVALLNYLAFRHFARWDFTSESRYTLSERSVAALESLEQDITLTLLLSEGESEFTDVRELLSRYDAASDRITVREVDPDRQPGEARRLAQRYDIRIQGGGEGESLSEVAALVTSGEQRWKITRDDLIQVGTADDGPRVDVQAERAVTGAIVALVRGEKTRVCLTTGHGERRAGAGERGLSFLRDEFERENAELVDLAQRDVPDDCDAVFVLGPRSAFLSEDARALVGYARNGGKLLLALDPLVRREGVQPSGFERALEDVGVRLDDTIIVETDRSRLLGADPNEGLLLAPQPHPVTMPSLSRGAPLLAGLSRTVRGDEESVVPLLEGSERSFGKRDLEALFAFGDVDPGPMDEEAPATMAVARTFEIDEDHQGRLLVFGNSDWMDDAALAEPAFVNGDMLLASVGWLTERPALVAVPPRSSRLRAVVMSEEDLSGVWRRVMLYLPGAFLLLGFSVWWSRRQ